MNPDRNDLLEHRRQAWNRYWRHGPLHSLATSFNGNYQGAIGQFWVQAFARLDAEQRVLDIATGNGAVPALLRTSMPELDVAIDAIDLAELSPSWIDMLEDTEKARTRFHANTRAEALPFEDASFDLATSQYGIEYSDHVRSLSELARVVRPGGHCAFVLHHARSHLAMMAEDEVTAAEVLLSSDGLLARAKALLPWLGLAAQGQVQRLRADSHANRDRSAFNAAANTLGELEDRLQNPALLQEARQFAFQLSDGVLKRQWSAEQAGVRLAQYRDDLEAARLRSQELRDHALDDAGIRRFGTTMEQAGFRDVQWSELVEGEHLLGWQLQASRQLTPAVAR